MLINVNWLEILNEITCGLEHLHQKHKILHNDLKGDNIVLTQTTNVGVSIGAVIIDFGKACDISKGKHYHLSKDEKEQYKIDHPHIAPDLRDGLCHQCVFSDIYSFGRIISIINSIH